jgi:hypothetical protein
MGWWEDAQNVAKNAVVAVATPLLNAKTYVDRGLTDAGQAITGKVNNTIQSTAQQSSAHISTVVTGSPTSSTYTQPRQSAPPPARPSSAPSAPTYHPIDVASLHPITPSQNTLSAQNAPMKPGYVKPVPTPYQPVQNPFSIGFNSMAQAPATKAAIQTYPTGGQTRLPSSNPLAFNSMSKNPSIKEAIQSNPTGIGAVDVSGQVMERARAANIPMTYNNGTYNISASSQSEFEASRVKLSSIESDESSKANRDWSNIQLSPQAQQPTRQPLSFFGFNIGDREIGGQTIDRILADTDKKYLLPLTERLPSTDAFSTAFFDTDIFTGKVSKSDNMVNALLRPIGNAAYTELKEHPSAAVIKASEIVAMSYAFKGFGAVVEGTGSTLYKTGDVLSKSGKVGSIGGAGSLEFAGFTAPKALVVGMGNTAKSTGYLLPKAMNSGMAGMYLGGESSNVVNKFQSGGPIAAGQEIARSVIDLYAMGKASEAGKPSRLWGDVGRLTGFEHEKATIYDVYPRRSRIETIDNIRYNERSIGVRGTRSPTGEAPYLRMPDASHGNQEAGVPGIYSTVAGGTDAFGKVTARGYEEPVGSVFLNQGSHKWSAITLKVPEGYAGKVGTKLLNVIGLPTKKSGSFGFEVNARETKARVANSNPLFQTLAGKRIYVNEGYRNVQLPEEMWNNVYRSIGEKNKFAELYPAIEKMGMEQANKYGEPVVIPSPKRAGGHHPNENEMYIVFGDSPATKMVTGRQFAGFKDGVVVQKIRFGNQPEFKNSVLGNLKENILYNTAIIYDSKTGFWNKNKIMSSSADATQKNAELYGGAFGYKDEYKGHDAGHLNRVSQNAVEMVNNDPFIKANPRLVGIAGKYHDMDKVTNSIGTPETQVPHGVGVSVAIRKGYFTTPELAALTPKERGLVSDMIAGHTRIKPFVLSKPGMWKDAFRTAITDRPTDADKVIANADKWDLTRFNAKGKEGDTSNIRKERIFKIGQGSAKNKMLNAIPDIMPSGVMSFSRSTTGQLFPFRNGNAFINFGEKSASGRSSKVEYQSFDIVYKDYNAPAVKKDYHGYNIPAKQTTSAKTPNYLSLKSSYQKKESYVSGSSYGVKNGGYKPTQKSSRYEPVIKGNRYEPKIKGSEYTPFIKNGEYKPTFNGGKYEPSIRGGGYMPVIIPRIIPPIIPPITPPPIIPPPRKGKVEPIIPRPPEETKKNPSTPSEKLNVKRHRERNKFGSIEAYNKAMGRVDVDQNKARNKSKKNALKTKESPNNKMKSPANSTKKISTDFKPFKSPNLKNIMR